MLANSRDSSLGTTSGAALARGAVAPAGGVPTAWALPAGLSPLLVGFGLAILLLVYWDRRVVFKS